MAEAMRRPPGAVSALCPLPDQPLLRHARHELAVARIEQAAVEAARAARARAVLRIEQPIVGAEGPMQPKRVVETGGLDLRLAEIAAVGDNGRAEQGHVGEERQSGAMDDRVVRQSAVDPYPQRLSRLANLAAFQRRVAGRVDRPEFDRPDAVDEALDRL